MEVIVKKDSLPPLPTSKLLVKYQEKIAVHFLVAFSLVALSGVLRLVERRTHVPHSLVIMAVTTLGSYAMTNVLDLETIVEDTLGFVKNDMLIMFLPALVFHTSSGINVYLFRKCLSEILLFALGTTAINTYLCMEYSSTLLKSQSGRRWSFILGALQSSTQRVSTSDNLLKRGKHPMLITILNFETLVGTVLTWDVINVAYHRIQQHPSISLLPLALELLYSMFLSGVCGCIIGNVVMALLVRAEHQVTYIVIVLMGCAYFTFLLLQGYGGCGIVGVIAFCVVTSSHTLITSTEIESTLNSFWEVFHDIGEVLSLSLASVYVGVEVLRNVSRDDLARSFVTYLVSFGARAVAVVCMLPFLTSVRYSARWQQAMVLIWVGMRGSFRICLAVHFFTELKMPVGDATRGIIHLVGVVVFIQLVNVMLFEYLLKALRFTDDSEVEQVSLVNAIRYLRHTTRTTIRTQRKENFFIPIDWKWVSSRTRFEDEDIVHEIVPGRQTTESSQPGLIRAEMGASANEFNLKAYEFAVENAIRIQKMSYQRQYLEGMIQKKTEVHLVATLQYPYETKTYLNIDMIRGLIAVPPWVYWMKSVLKSVARDAADYAEADDDDEDADEFEFDRTFRERAVEYFEHPYYELVLSTTTAGFALCLLGLLESAGLSTFWSYLRLAFQAGYLVIFCAEMGLMVYVYENRFIRTEYNRLDMALLGSCLLIFSSQCLTIYFGMPQQHHLGVTFLVLISVRLVHIIRYGEELGQVLLSAMHSYMDSIIYEAYESGLAVIRGEEEVRENIWKSVNDVLADEIRVHAGENRLEVLRQVVEVHNKFPGVAVAFKSRQACQSILNDVQRELVSLYKDGAIDAREYKNMLTAIHVSMREVLRAPCSFRSSYKPIAVLRVVPWMATDQLRQFLAMMIRPVSFEPGQEIISEGEDSAIIVTHSGIVKVSGEVQENLDGALPNTASFLYFYSDGYFEDYIAAPDIIGTLTIVSNEPCVTTVKAETAVNAYLIPKERLLEALEAFTEWPSFRYQLWNHICYALSAPLLQSQPQYQTWPMEKVKHRLELMLMPDLMDAKQFHVSPDVEDLLLIQGRVMDAMTEEEYLAPMYIPKTVKKIIFPGEVYSRPCPVMVIIANKQYQLPAAIDWVKKEKMPGKRRTSQDIMDTSYISRIMTRKTESP